MEQFSQFVGRFHPLWVHLPIGILLVAVLFDWLSDRKRFKQLEGSVNMLYFLGGLSAVFSCMTGYLLSRSGDYAGATLIQHQWLGITTALVALGIYFFRKKNYIKNRFTTKIIASLLFLLVSITGHLGGSLTHGADYLYVYMPQPFKSWFIGKTYEKPPIENVQEALVYQDIVVPILKQSCYKCHSTQKQKGNLRLDTPDFIAAGGKSGRTLINAIDPEESEILRRIHLPLNDDEHMPPNEKDELTEAEKALISWWIQQGASYEAQVKEIDQEPTILSHLQALENPISGVEKEPKQLYPEVKVEPANPDAIQALLDLRAVVIPVGQNSPLLSINFVNVSPINDTVIDALSALKKQIVRLKLSDTEFEDSHMAVIGQMPNISQLYLDHTKITDEGLKQLQNLEHLKFLNLVGTEVSKVGLEALKVQLPSLEQLFIYQTTTSADDKIALLKAWSNVQIDTGGYQMPIIRQDTLAKSQ
ncbi:MAG: c-type cytochrome domain-containing protein [Bacteroidota bacterium]